MTFPKQFNYPLIWDNAMDTESDINHFNFIQYKSLYHI